MLVKPLYFSNEPPVPSENLYIEEPLSYSYAPVSPEPVLYPLTNGFTEPEYMGSVEDTCAGLTLFLSSKCCFTTTPEDKLVLAGVKSLIILNKELSKNLIKRIKSLTS